MKLFRDFQAHNTCEKEQAVSPDSSKTYKIPEFSPQFLWTEYTVNYINIILSLQMRNFSCHESWAIEQIPWQSVKMNVFI